MVHPTVHRGGSDFGDAETSNWVGIFSGRKEQPRQKKEGENGVLRSSGAKNRLFWGKSGALAARSSLRAAQVEFWRVEGRDEGPSAAAQIELS